MRCRAITQPVTAEVVQVILSQQLDDLEPRLTRDGCDVRNLAGPPALRRESSLSRRRCRDRAVADPSFSLAPGRGGQFASDSPLEGNGLELPVRGVELAVTLGKTANVFERLRGASPQERWIATTPRRRASRSRQALRVRVAAIGWR